MGAAFLLIFLLWIAIWGGIGAAVASSRGIGTGMGFALGAALGLIGVVILLFMKPRAVPGPAGPATYGGPSAYGGTWAMRECPFCKSSIRRDASVCPHCQRESRPWLYHDGYWWSADDAGNQYWLEEGPGLWHRSDVESPPS